jgi:hypothetical protein
MLTLVVLPCGLTASGEWSYEQAKYVAAKLTFSTYQTSPNTAAHHINDAAAQRS